MVATYGDYEWQTLANERAVPSTEGHGWSYHDRFGTIASCRNEAAEQSSAEWFCFLDGDDRLAPGYVIAMEAAIASYYAPTNRVLFTPRVQHVRKGPPGEPFFYKPCSLKTGNWLVIGTVIHRDLFWEVGGFDDHPHGLEDWVTWAKAVKAGATIVKVPDAVYIAHLNPQSKHHELARDRAAYRAAYEHARASVWG